MARRSTLIGLSAVLLFGALILLGYDNTTQVFHGKEVVVKPTATTVASSAGTSEPAMVGVTGGIATVAVPSIPTTLNPHTVAGANDGTLTVASAIWPQTFDIDAKKAPQLNETFVSGAEVVGLNPQVVQYHVNPKAVWSDGTPIRAADFIADWEAQRGDGTDLGGAPDSVASTVGYDDISSVTSSALGLEVTVTFKRPYNDWESLFDYLLPAHVVDTVGWNTGFDSYNSSTAVSGGPFEIASWTPGVSLELVRNPLWWGNPAQLDEIDLVAEPAVSGSPGTSGSGGVSTGASQAAVIQNASADLSLAEQGLIYEYPYFTSASLAELTSQPGLETKVIGGSTSLQLEMNTASGALSDVDIRRAVAHLIDRTAIVGKITAPIESGAVVDNDHLLDPSAPGYGDGAGTESGSAPSVPKGTVAPASLPTTTQTTVPFSGTTAPRTTESSAVGAAIAAGYEQADPKASAALLEAAGLVNADDGKWIDNGKQMTLHLTWASDDPWSEAVAPILASQLRSAGIEVTLEPTPSANLYSTVLPKGQFDLALVPLDQSPFESDLEPDFNRATGDAPGGSDWSGLSDPLVDSLFNAAEQQLNGAIAWNDYQLVDTALWRDMASLPLFDEPELLAWSAGLESVGDNFGEAGLLTSAADWTELAAGPTTTAR